MPWYSVNTFKINAQGIVVGQSFLSSLSWQPYKRHSSGATIAIKSRILRYLILYFFEYK
jgi:hypothetical protein